MVLFSLTINIHPIKSKYEELLDTGNLVAMEVLAIMKLLTFFNHWKRG